MKKKNCPHPGGELVNPAAAGFNTMALGAGKPLAITGCDSAYRPYFRFFFSSRRRHTRCGRDWSSDVCSSDLKGLFIFFQRAPWRMVLLVFYKFCPLDRLQAYE